MNNKPITAIGFNWQNGGGYGNANDGLGITHEGVGPLQRCQTPAIAATQGVAIPIQEVGKRTGVSTTDRRAGIGIGRNGDVMFTMQAGAQHGVAATIPLGDTVGALMTHHSPNGHGCAGVNNQQVAAGHVQPVSLHENQRSEVSLNQTTGSVKCAGGKPGQGYPAVMVGAPTDAVQVQWASGGGQLENPTAQALRSGAEHNYQFLRQSMAVRRLTPKECERLQGFPDDHTLIEWRGKSADLCPDGPRYKALGNSMAVPCMAWIGKRIAAQESGPLRYLSVCSGIEAASVAWEPLGWKPAGFSEIEKFPSAVLAHHWPDVPNLGDMTKYEEWNLGTIDLLVGGTPCQSFSVAGLRKGLRDPRGGLMLTYLEIARRFRPRWLVWENVPGVLSSHGGRDFGAFLGALGDLGYGWSYRVLDAQWFGVAQRRRRVFVVANLGDGDGPAKVLFERESVLRNPAPSRETGERTAATLVRGAKGSGGIGYDNQALFSQNGDNFVRPSDYPDTAATIDAHYYKGCGSAAFAEREVVACLTDGAHNGGGLTDKMLTRDAYLPSVANPLTARMGKGINTTLDEGQTPIVEP